MDPKISLTIILGSVIIILLMIGVYYYRKDQSLKNNSTEKMKGTVIKYALHMSRAPVVEYWVDRERYEKSLTYSYITHLSHPFMSVKSQTKTDLLDTKLRVRQNSVLSVNTLMYERFPIGSLMTVYYNPRNPKEAYVERYAFSYHSVVFFIPSVLFILIIVIMWLFF